jgi:hypothetical protein
MQARSVFSVARTLVPTLNTVKLPDRHPSSARGDYLQSRAEFFIRVFPGGTTKISRPVPIEISRHKKLRSRSTWGLAGGGSQMGGRGAEIRSDVDYVITGAPPLKRGLRSTH